MSLKNLVVAGRRCKSFNSTEWLKRHNNDIYVEKAKKENYRFVYV
mgnify:CR=1 FL=1